MKLAEIWQEFKGFALKGNVIDLALAVVIGGAFGKVVDSLVKNILMPLLGYITPGDGYRAWKVGRVEVGIFLGEVVNFLIISLAMFIFVVKLLGAIRRMHAPTAAGESTTRECPHCLMAIPEKARRCAHCTSELAAG